MLYNQEKEIREAITAGEQALESLRLANRKLDAAGDWGLWDLFGGKLLSGIFKHQRIQDAKESVNFARAKCLAFQRELGDVHSIPDIDIQFDSLTMFADFFLDNFLTDIWVQSKIRDCQRRIHTAMVEIESALRALRSSQ